MKKRSLSIIQHGKVGNHKNKVLGFHKEKLESQELKMTRTRY